MVALDKFRMWNWRLLLRDRGAKASGLTEGIRSSAQVEFCSQLGANVRCPKIVTMSFVKETLPNLIIRPLLHPYRYKYTSRQGFPLTRHEQAVLQHNDLICFDLIWFIEFAERPEPYTKLYRIVCFTWDDKRLRRCEGVHWAGTGWWEKVLLCLLFKFR